MPEYIEREALFKRLKEETHDYDAVGKYKEGIIKGLNIAKSIVNDKARTPTADVVSREVFEQVKWERDTALQTLREHGIGLGQKADVVEAKHGEWIVLAKFADKSICTECSVCGEEYTYKMGRIGDFVHSCYAKYNYCPNCGAKMDLKEGAEK